MIDRWVETQSGVEFSLTVPSPANVCIEDIAHGLALICRYTGQCDRFYSVAEHSILCACLAKWEGLPADAQMACLLHDAAEAYIGDINGQVKRVLRDRGVQELDLLEDAVYLVVLQRLGLGHLYKVQDDVKRIDRIVFQIEEREMMPSRGAWLPGDWPQPPAEEDWIPTAMIGKEIGESWERAKTAFMRHYYAIRMEMGL